MKQLIDNQLIKVSKGYNRADDVTNDELNIGDVLTINPAYGDSENKEITIGAGNGLQIECFSTFNSGVRFDSAPNGICQCHYSNVSLSYKMIGLDENKASYPIIGYIIHGKVTVTAGGTIETLPSDFRPGYVTQVVAHTEDGTDAIITIDKNGAVKSNKALTNQSIFISVVYC